MWIVYSTEPDAPNSADIVRIIMSVLLVFSWANGKEISILSVIKMNRHNDFRHNTYMYAKLAFA